MDPGHANRRLIVGISGASGAIYGIRLLEVLSETAGIETHLVITPAGRQTIALETGRRPADVETLADVTYRHSDIAAAISSGSYPIDAMAIVPCSMKSVAGIALSLDDNLLVRAASVTLKEQRRLVLVPRESPLHLGHLRTLVQVAEMGAVVMPPMPAFYTLPETMTQLIDQTVMRVLDLLGVAAPGGLGLRWTGPRRNRGPADDQHAPAHEDG